MATWRSLRLARPTQLTCRNSSSVAAHLSKQIGSCQTAAKDSHGLLRQFLSGVWKLVGCETTTTDHSAGVRTNGALLLAQSSCFFFCCCCSCGFCTGHTSWKPVQRKFKRYWADAHWPNTCTPQRTRRPGELPQDPLEAC